MIFGGKRRSLTQFFPSMSLRFNVYAAASLRAAVVAASVHRPLTTVRTVKCKTVQFRSAATRGLVLPPPSRMHACIRRHIQTRRYSLLRSPALFARDFLLVSFSKTSCAGAQEVDVCTTARYIPYACVCVCVRVLVSMCVWVQAHT